MIEKTATYKEDKIFRSTQLQACLESHYQKSKVPVILYGKKDRESWIDVKRYRFIKLANEFEYIYNKLFKYTGMSLIDGFSLTRRCRFFCKKKERKIKKQSLSPPSVRLIHARDPYKTSHPSLRIYNMNRKCTCVYTFTHTRTRKQPFIKMSGY